MIPSKSRYEVPEHLIGDFYFVPGYFQTDAEMGNCVWRVYNIPDKPNSVYVRCITDGRYKDLSGVTGRDNLLIEPEKRISYKDLQEKYG